MARMTATDFVGFTRKRMGNPSTDEWTDSELLRFVNMAQERVALGSGIATLETYEDLSVTAALGATYEFAASDIMYITSVKNTTTGIVVKVTIPFVLSTVKPVFSTKSVPLSTIVTKVASKLTSVKVYEILVPSALNELIIPAPNLL